MNIPTDFSRARVETERTFMRPFRKRDLEDLHDYARDEGVGEMAGWPHHTSIETSKKVLNQFISEKMTLAIVDKLSKRVIGSISLAPAREDPNLPQGKRGGELSFVLNKKAWGHRLVPEALRGVLYYCFRTMDYDYLTSVPFVDNIKGRRVVESCTFEYLNDVECVTQLGTVIPGRQYIIHNFWKELAAIPARESSDFQFTVRDLLSAFDLLDEPIDEK